MPTCTRLLPPPPPPRYSSLTSWVPGACLPGLCSWEAIEEYIQERFEEFEQAETTIKRHDVRDSRIHCCLYFIAPCVHG